MRSGTINVGGFELNQQELVVKREFRGDTKRFEACSSDDGGLMVAIDTLCDEEVFQELRARQLAAAVQKLRKSSGLVVADKVEIFFEEGESTELSKISEALSRHAPATVKRIRTLPLPISLRPKASVVIATEVINDAELSSSSVKLVLTQAAVVSVDEDAVAALLAPGAAAPTPQAVAMYLQTMDYDRLLAAGQVSVSVDGVKLSLVRGVHFFGSALEMLLRGSAALKARYPHAPTAEAVSLA